MEWDRTSLRMVENQASTVFRTTKVTHRQWWWIPTKQRIGNLQSKRLSLESILRGTSLIAMRSTWTTLLSIDRKAYTAMEYRTHESIRSRFSRVPATATRIWVHRVQLIMEVRKLGKKCHRSTWTALVLGSKVVDHQRKGDNKLPTACHQAPQKRTT